MLEITVSSKILQNLMLYNFSFMICLSVVAGKKIITVASCLQDIWIDA